MDMFISSFSANYLVKTFFIFDEGINHLGFNEIFSKKYKNNNKLFVFQIEEFKKYLILFEDKLFKKENNDKLIELLTRAQEIVQNYFSSLDDSEQERTEKKLFTDFALLDRDFVDLAKILKEEIGNILIKGMS